MDGPQQLHKQWVEIAKTYVAPRLKALEALGGDDTKAFHDKFDPQKDDFIRKAAVAGFDRKRAQRLWEEALDELDPPIRNGNAKE